MTRAPPYPEPFAPLRTALTGPPVTAGNLPPVPTVSDTSTPLDRLLLRALGRRLASRPGALHADRIRASVRLLPEPRCPAGAIRGAGTGRGVPRRTPGVARRGGPLVVRISGSDRAFVGVEVGSAVSVSTHGLWRAGEPRQGFLNGLHEALERLSPSVVFVHGTVNHLVFRDVARTTELIHLPDGRTRTKRRAA